MQSSSEPFGDSYVLRPNTRHTHTVVLLHGRGSTGEEFANDLLASTLTSGQTLPSQFPGWRWVFPTSRELWSTVFQEKILAWFEAHSLTDITARQDLQVGGIRESVSYIGNILNEEIERLHGDISHVFLGGISQGGAVGMWTLLSEPKFMKALGGFVGASTWLPFANDIERLLVRKPSAGNDASSQPGEDSDGFVEEMMSSTMDAINNAAVSLTPVFLGHGQDDAYVDIELGRQAARILELSGMVVRFQEYVGAEEEGHWFKVPEEIQDIHTFLTTARIQSS